VGAGIGALTGADRAAGAAAPIRALADATEADPRLAGCWVPVAEAFRQAPGRAREAETAAVVPMVYRFTAAQSVAALQARAPAAASPPVGDLAGRRARTDAQAASAAGPQPTLVNSTALRSNDSTYIAGWRAGSGPATLTFQVHGDTLRGTIQGIAPAPAAPFTATRVPCPRAP
jgi:hypothetical protein